MTKLEFIRRAVSMNTEHIKALAEQQLVLMHTLAEFESSATEKREWQGLTEKELEAEMEYWSTMSGVFGDGAREAEDYFDVKGSWRRIEAKLKEKNG